MDQKQVIIDELKRVKQDIEFVLGEIEMTQYTLVKEKLSESDKKYFIKKHNDLNKSLKSLNKEFASLAKEIEQVN